MAGLSRSHCDVDCFIIAHFPEKNDIRALAQGCPQSSNVAFCIHVDLALADDAAFMAVKEFQRVLQCYNVFLLISVDLVYHTCEGSGFAASRRACDKNHSLAAVAQMNNIVRDSKFMSIRQMKGNDSYNCG